MHYTKQKNIDHYGVNYDNLERFISYFVQKECILKLVNKLKNTNSVKVLEIGKGNGFLSDYLRKNNINVKTFDLDSDLNPNFIGSITNIQQIIKDEKFDISCCFQILEHIKFEDVESVLRQLSAITSKYLIISVPQIRLYVSLWIKIPIVSAKGLYLSLPFPSIHVFDDQHYWELGKFGFGLNGFRKMLKNKFILIEEFVHPLNPYHRFFICKNKEVYE